MPPPHTAPPQNAAIQPSPAAPKAAPPWQDKSPVPSDSKPKGKPKSKSKPKPAPHVRPLPLQTHPLPALIPHNPLSILRILSVLLAHTIYPPSSHPAPHSSPAVSTVAAASPSPTAHGRLTSKAVTGHRRHGTYTAYYDAATRGVHVTDAAAAQALWEDGFFGKGSLSRSVPEWVELEQGRRRRRAARARARKDADEEQGVKDGDEEDMVDGKKTSAEVTGKRREERREEKRQRAKREAEAVEEQLRAEGQLESSGMVNGGDVGKNKTLLGGGAAAEAEETRKNEEEAVKESLVANGHVGGMNGIIKINGGLKVNGNLKINGTALPKLVRGKLVRFDSTPELIPPEILPCPSTAQTLSMTTEKISEGASLLLHRVISPIQTLSPIQTPPPPTPVPEPDPLINQEHLQLNPAEAFFLAYALGVLAVVDPITNQPMSVPQLLSLFRRTSYFPPLAAQKPTLTQPDDPFLLSYVVYHHFRSLGWVVRPGVKFAVDLLLYNRGPVFSHAEFAVLILPSYSHSYWKEDPVRWERAQKKEKKDWWWLHCANRVQSQVRKSLVLVYVDVPPPPTTVEENSTDVGALLRGYKVREFVLGRWTMNRNRD